MFIKELLCVAGEEEIIDVSIISEKKIIVVTNKRVLKLTGEQNV